MDVIVAVLKDLYRFATTYQFGYRTAPDSRMIPVDIPSLSVEKSETSTQTIDPPLLLPELPHTPTLNPATGDFLDGVGYAFVPDTHLYSLPTRSFDGVIYRLPYGTSFQIVGTQGKWCNVVHNDVRGWVHRDDLTESEAMLQPQLEVGSVYGETSPATIKLRTLIDDSFHAAQVGTPLQDVEYVSYRLQKKNRQIDWPSLRPRIAGTWQRILKGVLGVHMGINPKTDSVMEYVKEDNTGHVAYVESVYPDGSITISEVGYATEGEYTERTLGRQEWKELKPIFIEVN